MNNVTDISVEDLVQYITILETELTDSKLEATLLAAENKTLRCKIGAFKASSTRRKTGTDLLKEENKKLVAENTALANSVRAYKASATRRRNV